MKNIELQFAKCLKWSFLTVIIFGATAFTSNVRAQTARVFEIQIPFDFAIRDKTYAAGTYRIGRLSEANPDTLVLKNETDKKSLILSTQRLTSGDPQKLSKLTFRWDGETYFLDSIRASGETYESRLPYVKSDQRPSSPHLAKIVTITEK